jgi:predicted DNA-binding transcriptional regulator YafY
MKSTQRVILILKLLEIGKPLRTTDIAGRFNISIRTAYRDLELLRRMNLPLRIVDGAYSLNKSAWNKWTSRHIGQAIRRLTK